MYAEAWRLRIGCNLFVWLAPFGKMTICKLASRLAWLLCIQWDIGTMACAMCIVYSGRLVCAMCYVGHLHWYNDKCIANGACLLYMFIVYCGDLLICSLHWLGHNASCEGSSSFRWDRPDIHTIYTINYDVCQHCQLLYISTVWIMIKQILCWDIERKLQWMCQQLV